MGLAARLRFLLERSELTPACEVHALSLLCRTAYAIGRFA
jgi:hypothetical protein